MPSPYWIACSDIHNQTETLDALSDLRESAGSIICGDLTLAGGREAAQRVLEACSAYGPVAAALPGNMDKPEVGDFLREQGLNPHGRALILHPGIFLLGVGGSPPTPFHTPYELSEEKISQVLQEALAEALHRRGDPARTILVSHAPPFHTNCDRLRNGEHAGSRAVREFLEKNQPELCLCGHIHESRGSDRLGRTLILNPGPLNQGGYVKITLEENDLYAELFQIPGIPLVSR